MTGPFVHDIDPIIGTVLGVHLWWYGLAYVLGFAAFYGFVRSRREELGLSLRKVYDLTLLVAACVLLGGRFVEVAFYEWPFYRDHLHLIPAYWLGGMSTHGLLLGAIAGVLIFCRLHRRPFLAITDVLVIPGALIMGFGRIGNFIDGQIVGSLTDAAWGVKFPDAEGFRHPVVLYDAIKNLMLVPLLLAAYRMKLPAGAVTGLFLLTYAGLRLFVDLFREYPTTLLGLATGQILNITMSLVGLMLLVWSLARRGGEPERGRDSAVAPRTAEQANDTGWRPVALVALLAFSLVIPSDWTQDVPARYGKRHAGLRHSGLYPAIPQLSPAKPPPGTTTATPP